MVWGIVNYFKCSSIIFFLPYPSARSQFLFFLPPFARPFLALLAFLWPSIFDAVLPPLPVHLWRCLPPFVRPFMAMLASLCPSIYGDAFLPLPFYLWRCLPPFARPFIALLASLSRPFMALLASLSRPFMALLASLSRPIMAMLLKECLRVSVFAPKNYNICKTPALLSKS